MRIFVPSFRIFSPAVRPLPMDGEPIEIREVKSASPEVAQPAKKSGSRGRPSISPVLFIFLPSHNDFKQ